MPSPTPVNSHSWLLAPVMTSSLPSRFMSITVTGPFPTEPRFENVQHSGVRKPVVHVPLMQNREAQSSALLHVRPLAQGAHDEPPQSVSPSLPFFSRSVHVGKMHWPWRHRYEHRTPHAPQLFTSSCSVLQKKPASTEPPSVVGHAR